MYSGCRRNNISLNGKMTSFQLKWIRINKPSQIMSVFFPTPIGMKWIGNQYSYIASRSITIAVDFSVAWFHSNSLKFTWKKKFRSLLYLISLKITTTKNDSPLEWAAKMEWDYYTSQFSVEFITIKSRLLNQPFRFYTSVEFHPSLYFEYD